MYTSTVCQPPVNICDEKSVAYSEEDLERRGQLSSNKICTEASPEAALLVMQRVSRGKDGQKREWQVVKARVLDWRD